VRERTGIIDPFRGSPRRVSSWAARVRAGITLLMLVMTTPGCRRRERSSTAGPGVLLGWAVEHAPIVGQFVGDSTDDVIGVTQETAPVWRKNKRRRSERQFETFRYVDALDGSTLRQAWRIGPFDDAEFKNFHYARAGDHLVIVDGRGFVDVHAITSGRKIREIDLRGSALDLCAAPGEEAAVWLEMASGSHILLDPLTGQVRPSGRPAWCPWLEEPCRAFRSRARCSPPSPQVAAALAGFHPERVLENEGLRVVIGRSDVPHRGEEMCAVGLHVETGRVLWRTKLGDVVPRDTARVPLIAADLREGRLYLLYSGRGTRLAAVDARTGKEIFDVPLGAFFRGSTLGISSTRIAYHAGGSKVYLLVRDASTGKELVLRDP
jgi:hypothetical protein